MIRLFVLLHLIGFYTLACSNLYPTDLPVGMTLTESHYTDAQELAAVCAPADPNARACAFVTTTTCDIHLPLAANGDPMHRVHEIAHCSGKLDPPVVEI
jgi:hypothetical protein